MKGSDPGRTGQPVKCVTSAWVLAQIAFLAASGCGVRDVQGPPSIEFTQLPPAGEGSPDITYPIEGRVKGVRAGQKIVLFAHDGMWWVQPLAEKPFTVIQKDSTWKSTTHPGRAYAALLVDSNYRVLSTLNELPPNGGGVHAVATADGAKAGQAPGSQLEFSGYEWAVRQTAGNPAGTRNQYDAANAWVDGSGLHLRINKQPDGWTSALVSLGRSLGYGSYRFVVRDISSLEPPVVLAISSWDGSEPYKEMDIEISRWGEVGGKNAQFVLQPYYVPANVVRFLAPEGRLTYCFEWRPGRATFRTVRGGEDAPSAKVVASHVFTSGVPSPGTEMLHLNLYVFDNGRMHLQRSAEVIIEKFEYLP
jgi:hypothetical protein